MSTLTITNLEGQSVGSVALPAHLVDTSRGGQVVRDAIVAYHANQRQGTASTKTKGEVAGNGQKPWRQKGTGNARAGYRQSPIWRGGGVVFGPKPRCHNRDLNRKMLRLAFARIFADRVSQQAVTVVESLTVADAKTKNFVQLLKKLGLAKGVLVVVDDPDNNLLLAARNIPGVEVARASHVNVYQVARYPRLLITKAALGVIEQRTAGSKEAAQ
ncbi:MAG TPA: 50S ribosomal protein L4 [Kiritimatiellia bacterium]|nr:50S ribosomal protein L4 [Kiritimatiellia bacterium]HMP35446.1 50S ribosomal protein L4 [Kiritimatiellia bacterium]